jgi:hypothetical protein
MLDNNEVAIRTVIEYVKHNCPTEEAMLTVLGCSMAGLMIKMEAHKVTLNCTDGLTVNVEIQQDHEDY